MQTQFVEEIFQPSTISFTKYLFFTGKGGVGKTSTACATAVSLADSVKEILLVSTDPASNLQDVFETNLNSTGVRIDQVPNLTVVNLDPIQSAKEYRENVVNPFRGILPEEAIRNMEEQLSGSCTVEIAAFNEFSNYLANEQLANRYDHIIFDTAPTGHTLRMLQLPSAWNDFIHSNKHGASCLGQLSGLESQKEIYEIAVQTLKNASITTLYLVSRPESAPLKEAERSAMELKLIGIRNQQLIVNGLIHSYDDEISEAYYKKQHLALGNMPASLKSMKTYAIPMRSYNIVGLKNIRAMLDHDSFEIDSSKLNLSNLYKLEDVIENIFREKKKVIFTMGKGGVGKTSIAAAIALGLSKKGVKVHLATTDPADHLKNAIEEQPLISMSHIIEKDELLKYRQIVLQTAQDNNLGKEDLEYIEEDLKSPCTQEIAVFRAFANIVAKSKEEVVIIDTAPTGHTLLLHDSTQSYYKEVKRSMGDTEESIRELLPRLRDERQTEVIITTLPEATPVYESLRLEEDLKRAGIFCKWWIINQSLLATDTKNELLKAKAYNEKKWIEEVQKHTNGYTALIPWNKEEVNAYRLIK